MSCAKCQVCEEGCVWLLSWLLILRLCAYQRGGLLHGCCLSLPKSAATAASAGASAGASLRRGHPGGSMHLATKEGGEAELFLHSAPGLGLDLWGKPHRKLCGRRSRLGFRLRLESPARKLSGSVQMGCSAHLPLWRQGLLLRLPKQPYKHKDGR